MGIGLATWASVKAKIAVLPVDVTPVALLGAAFLCGIGDPLSLLAADRAFPGSAYAGVAKIGVWACSVFAALFGVPPRLLSPPAVAEARRAGCQLTPLAKAADNNAGWVRIKSTPGSPSGSRLDERLGPANRWWCGRRSRSFFR